MKRKFKQWWSTIRPISTKRTITSHLGVMNIWRCFKYVNWMNHKDILLISHHHIF